MQLRTLRNVSAIAFVGATLSFGSPTVQGTGSCSSGWFTGYIGQDCYEVYEACDRGCGGGMVELGACWPDLGGSYGGCCRCL